MLEAEEKNLIEKFDNLDSKTYNFSIKNFSDKTINSIVIDYQLEIIGIDDKINIQLWNISENKMIEINNGKSKYFSLGFEKQEIKYSLILDILNSEINENTNIDLKINTKYTITYNLNCFEIIINQDNEPPKFDVTYSTKEWTNQNVIVKVKPSEEVKEIEGFNKNNGIYEKILESNETKEIKVQDLAGNESSFVYDVNNIDKSPPKIIGIENNQKYHEIKYVKYIDDESQINKIEKIYYGDLLIDSNSDYYSTRKKLGIDVSKNGVTIKVLRAPKNIIDFKYYRVDSDQENYISSTNRKFKFSNLDKRSCKYYVIATDTNGNIYKSNILEKSGAFFEDLKVDKTLNGANISIIGLENQINEVQYNISSLENNIQKSGKIINNNFEFDKKDFEESNKFKINLNFLSNGNIIDIRNLYINLDEEYIKDTDNIFAKTGNYDITVKDNAGNVTSYTISLEIQ